jgi:hypothetical protein
MGALSVSVSFVPFPLGSCCITAASAASAIASCDDLSTSDVLTSIRLVLLLLFLLLPLLL